MNNSLPSNLFSHPSFDPARLLEQVDTEEARRAAEARRQILDREAHTHEERLAQIRAQQDGEGGLIEFVRYFWDILEPGRAFVDGWAIEAICQHLEAVTFGDITKLLINVSPGFMKSMLVNVFWPAWEWSAMDMAHLRYVSFSYGSYLTERDNGRLLVLLQSQRFQELWGHRLALREQGKIKISNDSMGWKFASSVGGIGTGERGDRVLLDDPHNVKEGESDAVRTSTTDWFQDSMQNRLNDLRESAIIVIMQRVHEVDVSGVILSDYPDYVHLCIPMEYDPLRHCETLIGWSDPRIEAGELAWPERYPEETLESFRKRRSLWASQYQQRPSPKGGGIIKRADWRLWDEEEGLKHSVPAGAFPAFEYVIASVDTAYTEKQENDPSALTVWGVWIDGNGNRRIMLCAAWAERYELHRLVTEIAKTCKRFKPARILVEAKATGISVAQEIRRLHARENWSVQLVDPKRLDKVARAYAVQYLFEAGLIFAPDRAWAEMVISECEMFPKGAHDDLVDTVTQALAHLRATGMAELPEERLAAIDDGMHDYKRKPALYPV